MFKQAAAMFRSSVKKFGASRPGAWLFARIGHPLDGPLLRVTGGRMSLTNMLAGVQVVQVTTIGAKSGLERTLPLTAVIDPLAPQNIALIASNWGQGKNPAWYYNLKANPTATCTINGRHRKYIAHEAGEDEYGRYWAIATSLHEGYEQYKLRNSWRKIPIMVLTPL